LFVVVVLEEMSTSLLTTTGKSSAKLTSTQQVMESCLPQFFELRFFAEGIITLGTYQAHSHGRKAVVLGRPVGVIIITIIASIIASIIAIIIATIIIITCFSVTVIAIVATFTRLASQEFV